jgi:hypothetical protein
MYYEESVIDGYMCWRTTPDGDWTRMTQKTLTAVLVEARKGHKQIMQILEGMTQSDGETEHG